MIRVALRASSALLVLLAFSGGGQVRADYLYTVSGLPAPIVNGQSIVVFSANPSPNHPVPGNATTDITLAKVLGFSANSGAGDHFNTPLTLNIDFADPAHPGSDAVATFTGTLAGTLASNQSSLFLQFPANTQNITLAGNSYAVSVPNLSIPVPGNGTEQPFGIHVQFTGGPAGSAPEPSTLLLAGLGIPLWGLRRLRKRTAQA